MVIILKSALKLFFKGGIALNYMMNWKTRRKLVVIRRCRIHVNTCIIRSPVSRDTYEDGVNIDSLHQGYIALKHVNYTN